MSEQVELAKLFKSVLELCKVQEGETLAILTENGERGAYAAAYLAAAQEMGANGFQLNLPKRPMGPNAPAKRTALTGNRPAIDVLKSTDIVIDLVGLLWSAEQQEILSTGTRMLLSREPVEVITRMFPTEQLRRRVEAAQAMLASAKELRIVSSSGTDVRYKLGKYPVITQYGYTDEPGRWDNLPGGFLYTGAYDDGVDGTVVINTGDLIFPFKRYVTAPVHLTVEKGRVSAIEGDDLDAEFLRTYMDRWNDPRAFAVSHIGWGMDEKAQWEFIGTSPLGAATGGNDGRSFCGNVLFSTGPNSELGGTNDTACHLDIPLRGCTLYLDGEEIVRKGEIVPSQLRASAC